MLIICFLIIILLYLVDVEQEKETKRIKQELYRFELRKQIEEKKSLELEQKRKEQIDDEAIFKLARDHGKKSNNLKN